MAADAWFIPDKGRKPSGPYKAEEIRRFLVEGRVQPDTLCWREEMADWQPLRSIPEFAEVPKPPRRFSLVWPAVAVLLIVLAVVSWVLWAEASQQARLREATALNQAGQHQQARDLLTALREKRADDPELAYQLALAHCAEFAAAPRAQVNAAGTLADAGDQPHPVLARTESLLRQALAADPTCGDRFEQQLPRLLDLVPPDAGDVAERKLAILALAAGLQIATLEELSGELFRAIADRFAVERDLAPLEPVISRLLSWNVSSGKSLSSLVLADLDDPDVLRANLAVLSRLFAQYDELTGLLPDGLAERAERLSARRDFAGAHELIELLAEVWPERSADAQAQHLLLLRRQYELGNPRAAALGLQRYLSDSLAEAEAVARLARDCAQELRVREPELARDCVLTALDLEPTVFDTEHALYQAILMLGEASARRHQLCQQFLLSYDGRERCDEVSLLILQDSLERLRAGPHDEDLLAAARKACDRLLARWPRIEDRLTGLDRAGLELARYLGEQGREDQALALVEQLRTQLRGSPLYAKFDEAHRQWAPPPPEPEPTAVELAEARSKILEQLPTELEKDLALRMPEAWDIARDAGLDWPLPRPTMTRAEITEEHREQIQQILAQRYPPDIEARMVAAEREKLPPYKIGERLTITLQRPGNPRVQGTLIDVRKNHVRISDHLINKMDLDPYDKARFYPDAADELIAEIIAPRIEARKRERQLFLREGVPELERQLYREAGYVQYDGRWLTPKERFEHERELTKKALTEAVRPFTAERLFRAAGWTKRDGEWFPPEDTGNPDNQ